MPHAWTDMFGTTTILVEDQDLGVIIDGLAYFVDTMNAAAIELGEARGWDDTRAYLAAAATRGEALRDILVQARGPEGKPQSDARIEAGRATEAGAREKILSDLPKAEAVRQFAAVILKRGSEFGENDGA